MLAETTLRQRPFENVASKVTPTISWREAVRLVDGLTNDGATVAEAAAKVFQSNKILYAKKPGAIDTSKTFLNNLYNFRHSIVERRRAKRNAKKVTAPKPAKTASPPPRSISWDVGGCSLCA